MDLLGALGSLLGGGAAGGLIGLAGTWLKAREERETKRLDHAHELSMRELSMKEMEREADLRLRQTEAEVAGELAVAQEVAAGQAQVASYGNDRATYSSGWKGLLSGWVGALAAFMMALVDFARGMIRPMLTVYLIAILSTVALYLYKLTAAQSIPADRAWELLSMVVTDIAFLASTAVTWWFGSRPNKR